ncbi:MAG: hypothetical protein ACYTGL_11105 [Planctomycetota bacterium]|jgi:hypothetical protein
MNSQQLQIGDGVMRRVREEAAHAVSAELVPHIVFDVLSENMPDPAHTAQLQDVKLLLVEAYRVAGVSAQSLARKPAVA